MKILVIAFEFPPEGGGIGTYSYQIANNLRCLDVDVTALALTSRFADSEIKNFDEKQNFKIIRFKKYRNWLITVIYRVNKALQLISREKYDLIYIGQVSAGVIGVLARILFNIPYVIVGHGTEILQKFRRAYTKYVYNKSNHIIVNSMYTKDLFTRSGIYQKMEIVTPGGDDTRYDITKIKDQRFKARLGLTNKFVILTVGSLSERKDHATVLKAIKLIEKKCDNIHYLIVGTGPLKEYLSNIVQELELNDKVTFYGYASEKELPNLYACCDLFILNSKRDREGDVEGFGIVLIEANLMGKAVIGITGTGMEDAIEEEKSGLLINMDDPSETAAAILRLINDPELCKRLGEYGRNRALARFTWLKSAEKTKELFVNILDKKML